MGVFDVTFLHKTTLTLHCKAHFLQTKKTFAFFKNGGFHFLTVDFHFLAILFNSLKFDLLTISLAHSGGF